MLAGGARSRHSIEDFMPEQPGRSKNIRQQTPEEQLRLLELILGSSDDHIISKSENKEKADV